MCTCDRYGQVANVLLKALGNMAMNSLTNSVGLSPVNFVQMFGREALFGEFTLGSSPTVQKLENALKRGSCAEVEKIVRSLDPLRRAALLNNFVEPVLPGVLALMDDRDVPGVLETLLGLGADPNVLSTGRTQRGLALVSLARRVAEFAQEAEDCNAEFRLVRLLLARGCSFYYSVHALGEGLGQGPEALFHLVHQASLFKS